MVGYILRNASLGKNASLCEHHRGTYTNPDVQPTPHLGSKVQPPDPRLQPAQQVPGLSTAGHVAVVSVYPSITKHEKVQ